MTRMKGRHPRAHNPGVPHMSALKSLRTSMPVIPASVDHTAGMPSEFGMMLNDTLGDCTCAAFYHARQVWTKMGGGREITDPDKDVLDLYMGACGYRPGHPETDQGGNEQHVLTYLHNVGALTGSVGKVRDRILAFFEVDHHIHDDVKLAILEAGVLYIGFNVPSLLDDPNCPDVWDVVPGKTDITGGHAVVLTGYDTQGVSLISWGQKYKMTWAFFDKFVDEAYAIVDKNWFMATGKTPLGLTVQQLEQQMAALRA